MFTTDWCTYTSCFSRYWSLVSFSLSHISFLLLCALKLIVMRRVVCQSWWWICLWVERADFPWVVCLSLFLSYSFSFSPFLCISPSNQREPLSPHFPLQPFPPLQGASAVWHPDLIRANPQLEGLLTIGLNKETSRDNWDPDFVITVFRVWGIACTALPRESIKSYSAVVLMSHFPSCSSSCERKHQVVQWTDCRLHTNTSKDKQQESKKHTFNNRIQQCPESAHAWVMRCLFKSSASLTRWQV